MVRGSRPQGLTDAVAEILAASFCTAATVADARTSLQILIRGQASAVVVSGAAAKCCLRLLLLLSTQVLPFRHVNPPIHARGASGRVAARMACLRVQRREHVDRQQEVNPVYPGPQPCVAHAGLVPTHERVERQLESCA